MLTREVGALRDALYPGGGEERVQVWPRVVVVASLLSNRDEGASVLIAEQRAGRIVVPVLCDEAADLTAAPELAGLATVLGEPAANPDGVEEEVAMRAIDLADELVLVAPSDGRLRPMQLRLREYARAQGKPVRNGDSRIDTMMQR